MNEKTNTKSKIKSSILKIKKWISREFQVKETLPSEFSNLPNMDFDEMKSRENRIKLWSRYL